MRKKRMRLFSKIGLVVFVVSVAVVLIQMQIQINDQTARAEQLQITLEKRRQEVAQLESVSVSELDEETIMRIAREQLELVLPGARIFVDVSR